MMNKTINIIWFKRDFRVSDHSPLTQAAAIGSEVSFDKIKHDRGLSGSEVIVIMRGNLKPSSFKLWRKRVSGRGSKHEKRNKLLRQEIE
jgi:uncharacterized protein (TIGR03643 family)